MKRPRICKLLEVRPGHIVRAVEVYFKSGAARTVEIAGDFGSRAFKRMRMNRVGRNLWRIHLRLVPGRYHFQFIVDGRRLEDPQSCGADPARPGRARCALRVE